jgi:hypothetical protein
MIERLVEFYDTTEDIVPPNHTGRNGTVRVDLPEEKVYRMDRRFIYPNPQRRGPAADSSVGVDKTKWVTGYDGNDEPEGGWKETRYGQEFRRLLREHKEKLDLCGTILKALPEVCPKILDLVDGKDDWVVFFIDGEPVVQPAENDLPTDRQARLQEVNIAHLSEELAGDHEAECMACGDIGPIMSKNLDNTSLNSETFEARQLGGHSIAVCTECGSKANAAEAHLAYSDQEISIDGSRWMLFSTEPTEHLPKTVQCLRQGVPEEGRRQFWRAVLNGKQPASIDSVTILHVADSDASGQHTAYGKVQVRDGNYLLEDVSEWLSVQGGLEEAIGVPRHMENVSPVPASDDENRTRLYGDSVSDAPLSLQRILVQRAMEGRRLPTRRIRSLINRIRNARSDVRGQDLGRIVPTILWSVDMDTTSTAYTLGQLLALGDKLYDRIDDESYQMSDRYYQSLSSRPERVLGRLVSDMRTRLSQLQNDNPGSATNIDEELQKLLSGVEDPPETFDPAAQAQFALGYYHYRRDRFTSNTDSEPNSTDE